MTQIRLQNKLCHLFARMLSTLLLFLAQYCVICIGKFIYRTLQKQNKTGIPFSLVGCPNSNYDESDRGYSRFDVISKYFEVDTRNLIRNYTTYTLSLHITYNAYPRTSTTILCLIQILRFFDFFSSQGKNHEKKSQNSNEVKNGCTRSRIRIDYIHHGWLAVANPFLSNTFHQIV